MRKIRFLRGLSFFDSLMLGIGFIIGSGIMLMPIIAAKEAGTFSLIAWVIAGIYCILTGFCFAECAAKMPKAGGLYSYAHAAFGDFIGFMTGWTFWFGYWITIATEQWAVALYLKFFLPQLSDFFRVLIAAVSGLFLTALNFRGVKGTGDVGDVFTIGKLLPLILFAAVGLFFINTQNYFPLLPAGKEALPAIGSAIILVLWAYQGAEIITVPEEEIKNAKKTVPKAIIISVITVMGIYLLVSGVALGVARWENFAGSQSPLADISEVFLGKIGGIVLAVGGLISIFGALNAVILASSRISFAMSRDKLFPKSFSRLHSKFRTPHVALLVQTALAMILTFVPFVLVNYGIVLNFSGLASLVVFFTIIPYLLSSLAVLKLIKRAKGQLHIIESRLIPVLSGVASMLILVFFYNQTFVLLIGLTLFCLGLVAYALRKKFVKM
jgi:APA family basic amino acid/polyamine antiporter